LPVLFWIHGGAWSSGSGGWPWYDGARLAAEQNIVVVTINYRLGPFGYLHLPQWDPAVGNLGYQDQTVALQWVAQEITSFGGDPQRITVAGQSAGAHSAALLASGATTAPLIRRLILQSGPLRWPLQAIDQAAASGHQLLRELGFEMSSADELRGVEAQELAYGSSAVARRGKQFAKIVPPFQPVATEMLPWLSPLDALERGANPNLDIVVGATSQELRAFFDVDLDVMNADRSTAIRELDQQSIDGADTYTQYERQFMGAPATPGQILTQVLGDLQFREPAWALALQREKQSRPTYVYEFDWRKGPFGSCHCIELPFFFGTEEAFASAPMLQGIGAEFDSVSRSFRDSLGRFVRTGEPGWSPFTESAPRVMRFSTSQPAVDPVAELLSQRRLLDPARTPYSLDRPTTG
jgi:para-nitrobenzyl esterase